MNKFERIADKITAESLVSVFMILAFLLVSGCISGDKADVNPRKADTVSAMRDSSPRQDIVVKDTVKKQKYVPPAISEEAMQKALIYRRDSSFHVYSNIRADYRIIGYESPDTNSRKMILFSVFTSDVEHNPFHCPYGSYYDSAQGNELLIKYTGEQGSFIKATINGEKKQPATVYFQKKWIEFNQ